MPAYYNENDPFAAAWLRELIKANLIAPGEVDERSIEDVKPEDFRGFTQCHFFAGIGVWSYALRAAGWPDGTPVWTGSCPCQPFSASGKGEGFDDKRHLWPAWYGLIRECRPHVIFGEQVADKAGLAWFDVVSADLERAGYAVGAADICAAGVGAPHIRQRLWFVANALRAGRQQIGRGSSCDEAENGRARRDGREPHGNHVASGDGETRRVADPDGGNASAEGLQRSGQHRQQPEDSGAGGLADPEFSGWRGRRPSEEGVESGEVERSERLRATGELGDATRRGLGMRGSAPGNAGRAAQSGETRGMDDAMRGRLQNERWTQGDARVEGGGPVGALGTDIGAETQKSSSSAGSFWSDAEWILCRPEPGFPQGRYRPVEPGTFPLVTGAPARVGRLRGYGNALNAEAAIAFIEAYLTP